MKIMTNASYFDLLGEIERAESSLSEERFAIKKLNREKARLESNNKGLSADKVRLSKEREMLNSKLATAHSSTLKLSNKLRKSNSRCGGLTKQNNKLKRELEVVHEILKNYRDYFKRNHVQLTINQYDKRIPPLRKHKSK